MQNRIRKYYRLLRKVTLCVTGLLITVVSQGQTADWKDSVKELRYQIDTTAVYDSGMTDPEDSGYDDEPMENDTIVREYFLRKEFTGGMNDSLQLRRLPSQMIRDLKNQKDFWYADGVFRKKGQQKTNSSFSGNPILQTILWVVIIGGFIGFLVIYLANSNAGLFRKSRSLKIPTDQPEEQDIFSINYEQDIMNAEKAGDYRLAIRLMFLKLLRELSDRGLIGYKPDSTNSEYLAQLYQTPVYNSFARLARSYEYTWYGQFPIDGDMYARIKKVFANFEFATSHKD